MQQLEREVKPFGKGSAHITLPKEMIGKKVIITDFDGPKPEKPITWQNIDKRIEDKIEETKRGY